MPFIAFCCIVVDPPATIYMGKDKFENEDLIKYGFEEDVWFHVDNLSSAHVYLRMNPGQTWDNLPEALLEDLAQLTKANSITGNKQDNITVIYTSWGNLLKNQSMATGQVSFKSSKRVKKVFVKERINSVVNRLNKTKVEKFPDFAKMKVDNNKERSRLKNKEMQAKRLQKKQLSRQAVVEKENSSYDRVFESAQMKKSHNSDFDDFI
ncbi:hypothetical protein BB560_003303 [Smittium megazygosporum]|uniref:NFACT RNA-binding domain-containing protein n=1 Tax=Smittium megazygosporum TaxID=133381 RepID=A0A2T9ZCC3_9FUNG|nr:hypothetical protein BB560_003303 [Smittium megazygosporum]